MLMRLMCGKCTGTGGRKFRSKVMIAMQSAAPKRRRYELWIPAKPGYRLPLLLLLLHTSRYLCADILVIFMFVWLPNE